MDSYVVRMLVALLLGVFLVFQARGATAQPHRRRAFWLGAAALLMLAAYNGMLVLNATPGPLQTGLAIAGMALNKMASKIVVVRNLCLMQQK